ncbi:MAG: tyrosine-type recombinase/integrase [Eubacteriales bacterium]
MDKKTIKYHNKSDRPDNLVKRENDIIEKCIEIQKLLPDFMKGYFIYLKTSVLPLSRLAYLRDVSFFCNYIIGETDISKAKIIKDISSEEFDKITSRDINYFIGEYCTRYKSERTNPPTVYSNGNRSLSRKRSSLSVLFKYLYRDGIVTKNITEGFNPIKLPKPGEKEIKILEDDEVKIMLDTVTNGTNLSKKEREFWEITKKRDKAILILFVTYGLRLYELEHLNLSSFNFSRGEFKIYRKRGKEAEMPLNKSVEKVIKDYMENERLLIEGIQEVDKDALFISIQGGRLTQRALRELVKKYTAKGMGTSKGGGYSPHKLRATAATSLINQGNSIFDVQNLLDHENVTTTQLYAAHKKNSKKELIKNFEWLDEFEK